MPLLKSRKPPFRAAVRIVSPVSVLALAAAAMVGCGRTTIVDLGYGAACSEASPCGEARACVFDFPGGYCTERCTAATPCDPGGVCDESLGGLCLDECVEAADCRDGYQCWRGACRPDCTSEVECGGAPARCVAGTCTGPECVTSVDCGAGRTCVDSRCITIADAGPMTDAPGLLGAGAACTASAQCGSGLCLPAARGGVCTVACTDGGSCPPVVPFSSACGGATIDGTTGTFCVPYDDAGALPGAPCATDAECGTRTCAGGLCTEGCDDGLDCTMVGAGWDCSDVVWGGGSIRACAWPPVTGVTISEVDLGTVSIGAMRVSGDYGLIVPADAVSTTLRAEHVGRDSLPMTFYETTAPSGLEIYDVNELSMLTDQHVRWIPADDYDAIAMLVPNGSPGRAIGGERFTFEQGRYRFTIAAYERMAGDTGAMDMRVSALVKRAPGARVTAGTLDLAIHLVGVGITAAAAPTNTRVVAFVDRLDTLLGQIGIGIGAVTYHDVTTASLAVIDSTTGPTSELAQLFRLSAGRTGNVASIFLVRSVNSGGDGFNTLGIAGGIPGPSGIHGSMSSGVVVSFDTAVVGTGATGARFAGHVGAHELSHYLGLFHVTERMAACTGTMVPPACAPFGSTDTIADTTRGDTSNLMHWSIVGSGSNTTLTAGQGYVLLRSALVR